MGWGLLHLFPRPRGVRKAWSGWVLLNHILFQVQGGLKAHGFGILAQWASAYRFLLPSMGAGFQGGREREGGKGRSEVTSHRPPGAGWLQWPRLHLLFEPVEVLGWVSQADLQPLQPPEAVHLLEKVTVGRAGGSVPGRGWAVGSPELPQHKHVSQHTLEAGAEVGPAAALLDSDGLEGGGRSSTTGGGYRRHSSGLAVVCPWGFATPPGWQRAWAGSLPPAEVCWSQAHWRGWGSGSSDWSRPSCGAGVQVAGEITGFLDGEARPWVSYVDKG